MRRTCWKVANAALVAGSLTIASAARADWWSSRIEDRVTKVFRAEGFPELFETVSTLITVTNVGTQPERVLVTIHDAAGNFVVERECIPHPNDGPVPPGGSCDLFLFIKEFEGSASVRAATTGDDRNLLPAGHLEFYTLDAEGVGNLTAQASIQWRRVYKPGMGLIAAPPPPVPE